MATPLLPPDTGRPETPPPPGAGGRPRGADDLRCTTCGYGAVLGPRPAPRCPMCGGTEWELWVGRPRRGRTD